MSNEMSIYLKSDDHRILDLKVLIILVPTIFLWF